MPAQSLTTCEAWLDKRDRKPSCPGGTDIWAPKRQKCRWEGRLQAVRSEQTRHGSPLWQWWCLPCTVTGRGVLDTWRERGGCASPEHTHGRPLSFPEGREEVSICVPAGGAHELHSRRLCQHAHLPTQVLWSLHWRQVLYPLQVQDHRCHFPVSRGAGFHPSGPMDQCLLLQPEL